MDSRVGVGVGILILSGNKVLLGKRKGSHGEGSWSLPGGHLNFNESFEECALREVKEETGLDIVVDRLISVSNDISYGKHYVTIGMLGKSKGGILGVKEPDKCKEWGWFELDELPSPIFIPSEKVIKNYLSEKIYTKKN